jgi:hypothetical protein
MGLARLLIARARSRARLYLARAQVCARARQWLLGALLVCGASTALALSSLDASQAGWMPLIKLCGRGDAPAALQILGQLTSAYGTVLHRTDIDKPTQRFVDDALELLSDFDLEGFHQLLPERNREFRELWVRGELQNGRYAVKRADGGSAFRVGIKGPRRGLFDLSETVRAKLYERSDSDERSYLLGARVGFGIGKLSWDNMVAAGIDFGRMVATADPRGAAADKTKPSQDAVQAVRKLHPKLAPEDVESAALLFDAYPATARAISQMGELQNLREADTGKGYQHITVSMRGLPERLAQHHPELARHLRKMGKIGRFDVRWVDGKNRSLMNWFIDSDTLAIRTDCYVKDGQLLPFLGKTVFADEPIDLLGHPLKHTRTIMNGRFQLLGVVVKITNLKSDLFFEPHGTYAELLVKQTSLPGVEVEGAALGFVPTGLIDAFIPGNIRSLTLDFFRVATTGNDKKGIAIWVNVGSEQAGGDGVIEAGIDIEALDNRLVKMGVAMTNDRMVLDESEVDDEKALLSEIHAAFVKDLSRFRTRVQSGTGLPTTPSPLGKPGAAPSLPGARAADGGK